MSETNPRLPEWLAALTPDAPIYAALYTGQPPKRTEAMKLPHVFASGESVTFDPAAITVDAVVFDGEVYEVDHMSPDDLLAHALIDDDDLWRATEATAKHNGESVAATVRRALAEYLIEKGVSE